MVTGQPTLVIGCTHTHSKPICDCGTAQATQLFNSRPLKDAKHFVKAASGVVSLGDSTYVVQDSSRYLAEVKGNGDIAFHAIAPLSDILKYEAPDLPYLHFRKDHKADFESLTILPDGRILVLGSGYDVQKLSEGKASFKSNGALFDPITKTYEALDLKPFYSTLVTDSAVVGDEHNSVKPRLNIEGVAIFDNKIAFFHRSNYNKNSHDAVIVYALDAWLSEIRKSAFSLARLFVQVLDFGYIEQNGSKFPVTLNDALYADGYFYVPLAVETDTIVDGLDFDGEVIWKGLAKFKLAGDAGCEIVHFDDPALPKIEGIGVDSQNPHRFVVVHDADDEDAPSWLSFLARF